MMNKQKTKQNKVPYKLGLQLLNKNIMQIEQEEIC